MNLDIQEILKQNSYNKICGHLVLLVVVITEFLTSQAVLTKLQR